MSFRRHAAKAAVTLARAGEDYSVVRRSVTGSDRYGGESYSWGPAGTVRGVVFYGSRSREIRAEDSGRIRSDRPNIMVAPGADLEEDDRVVVNGTEYRVDSIIKYPTHMEASLRGQTD